MGPVAHPFNRMSSIYVDRIIFPAEKHPCPILTKRRVHDRAQLPYHDPGFEVLVTYLQSVSSSLARSLHVAHTLIEWKGAQRAIASASQVHEV